MENSVLAVSDGILNIDDLASIVSVVDATGPTDGLNAQLAVPSVDLGWLDWASYSAFDAVTWDDLAWFDSISSDAVIDDAVTDDANIVEASSDGESDGANGGDPVASDDWYAKVIVAEDGSEVIVADDASASPYASDDWYANVDVTDDESNDAGATDGTEAGVAPVNTPAIADFVL